MTRWWLKHHDDLHKSDVESTKKDKKGVKERKKDWKTKLTYQLLSTYISKSILMYPAMSSRMYHPCHPVPTSPGPMHLNIRCWRPPLHPSTRVATFDLCSRFLRQKTSATQKHLGKVVDFEISWEITWYDLVSHFIHICSFPSSPHFVAMCCLTFQ